MPVWRDEEPATYWVGHRFRPAGAVAVELFKIMIGSIESPVHDLSIAPEVGKSSPEEEIKWGNELRSSGASQICEGLPGGRTA
jgi:hypothetical protein